MRSLRLAAAAAAAVAVAGAAAAQEGDWLRGNSPDMARDLVIVQRPMAELAALKSSDLKLEVRFDRENATYQVGDDIQIFVKPSQDLFVTVVNVGTSGATTVLFPNSQQPNNKVRAGATLQLPPQGATWAIQAQGLGGVEVIKVLASTSPTSVFADGDVKPAGPFQAHAEGGEAAAKDLSNAMKADAGARWTSETRLLRVNPRAGSPRPLAQ